MADAVIIGKVAVRVMPETKNFRREAQAQLEKIERQLRDIEVKLKPKIKHADFDRAIKEVERKADKAGEMTFRINPDSLTSVHRNIAQLEREIERLGEVEVRIDRGNAEAMEEELKALRDNLWIELQVDPDSEASVQRALRQIDAQIERTREVELKVDVNHASLIKAREELERMIPNDINARLSSFGSRLGRMFGKGSRNDFLNFFGTMVGSITLPIQAMVKLGEVVTKTFSKIVDAFDEARAAGMGLGKALAGSVVRGLAAMATNLPAVLIGFAAMAVILPAIASGLLLMLGALTAVVSAISVGLMGGLLALTPVLAGLVAGVGAAVVAWQALKGENDKMSKSTEETVVRIKNAWRDLKKEVLPSAREMADQLARTAEGILKNFVSPLVKNMMPVFEDIIRHFDRMMSSKAIKGFLSTFTTALPRIVGDLGRGFNNLLGGLIGLIAAVLPYAEKLTGGFEKLTERFRDWATSADGQNSITKWMDMAWKAADSLWGILGNVLSIIGKIFTSGTEGAGQDFLTYLEKVTDKFDKWLSTDEGRASMKKFWEDVRETMKKIKEFIEDIVEGWDKLDTEESRNDFNTILDAVTGIAEGVKAIGTAITAFNTALKLSPGAGEGGLFDVEMYKTEWENLKKALTEMPGTNLFDKEMWSQEFENWKGMWESVKTWVSEKWNEIGDWAMKGFFKGLGIGVDWGKWVDEEIVQPVKDFLGIHSPSRVFMQIGMDVVAGFILGLASMPGQVGAKLGEVGSIISAKFGEMKTTIATKTGEWKTAVSTKTGEIRTTVSGWATDMRGKVGQVGSFLVSNARDAWGSAQTAWRNGVSTVRGIVGTLAGAVIGALASLPGTLYGIGQSAVQGLVSGIGSLVDTAATAAANLASRAINAARSMFAINSPSKVFRSMGYSVGEGLVDGLDGSQTAVAKAAERLAEAAVVSGQGVLDGFKVAPTTATAQAAAAGGTAQTSGLNLSIDARGTGATPEAIADELMFAIRKVRASGAY